MVIKRAPVVGRNCYDAGNKRQPVVKVGRTPSTAAEMPKQDLHNISLCHMRNFSPLLKDDTDLLATVQLCCSRIHVTKQGLCNARDIHLSILKTRVANTRTKQTFGQACNEMQEFLRSYNFTLPSSLTLSVKPKPSVAELTEQ